MRRLKEKGKWEITWKWLNNNNSGAALAVDICVD